MREDYFKQDKLVLSGLILLAFVAFFYATSLWAFVCLAVLAALSVFRFRLAVFFYLTLLPAWDIIGGVGAYTGLVASYIFIFIFIARLLANKEKLLAVHFLLLIVLVIFFALAGSLFSAYYEYLHTVLVIIAVLLTSYIMANQIIKNANIFYYITAAFIVAGLISIIVSFLDSGGDFRRLTLGGISYYEGGNVRQLANVSGASLIFFVIYLKELRSTSFSVISNSLFFICAAVFIAGLLFTNSRGVIFAVLASLGVYYMFTLKITIKNIIFIVFSILIIFMLFSSLTSFLELDKSLALLTDRLGDEAIEGGLSSRQEIWLAGLSNMSLVNYMFGHGLSSFRYLALQSGVDYYSHSVFIAILTDVGVIPLSFLLLFIGRIMLNVKRNRSLFALPILIYAVLAHISHGALDSKYFWMLLAISFAASQLKPKNNMGINV